jgi:hypothetical protein
MRSSLLLAVVVANIVGLWLLVVFIFNKYISRMTVPVFKSKHGGAFNFNKPCSFTPMDDHITMYGYLSKHFQRLYLRHCNYIALNCIPTKVVKPYGICYRICFLALLFRICLSYCCFQSRRRNYSIYSSTKSQYIQISIIRSYLYICNYTKSLS